MEEGKLDTSWFAFAWKKVGLLQTCVPSITKSKQTFTKNKTFTLCMAALGRREEKEKYKGRERRGKWKGNSFPFMCLDNGREGEQKRSKCLLLLFGMWKSEKGKISLLYSNFTCSYIININMFKHLNSVWYWILLGD